jgi:F-type H+-transporting ATPase subunit epsilon
MAATMHIDVVSAEESIYSGEAEFVVLPGIMGELGIYPRHTPLITQIKAGTVRIKVPGKTEEELVYVQGGFLEVQPDHVNVLSDTAIRAADLDEAKVLEAKRAAEEAVRARTEKQGIATAEAELAAISGAVAGHPEAAQDAALTGSAQMPLSVVILAAGQGSV